MIEIIYKKKPNSRHGLVTWRMLAPEINAELARSRSKSKMFNRFADRLNISYSQFTHYCRTLNQTQANPGAGAPASRGLTSSR